MKVHDSFKITFCHGDLHPLNVIWENNKVKAIIDWEFKGFKLDVYDVTNLVGCADIENPKGTGQPMVMAFLDEIKRAAIINQQGWQHFVEYIIA
jgi:homoserine kinase type II